MKILNIIKVLAVSLLLIPGIISAQEVNIKRKEFRQQPAGFEEAWDAIKVGNDFYEMGPAAYRDAREFYLKAYTYNDKNAALNYRIGMCFLYTDQKYEAAKYFTKAYEINPYIAEDIHYRMARGYHMRLEFDNAIKSYTLYKNSFTPKKYKKLNLNIDKMIEECFNGKEIIKTPQRVIISSLGTSINSTSDDYGSIINKDDSIMIYTSRRPLEKAKKRIRYDNKFPEKIYQSIKKNDKWSKGTLMTKPFINKAENDAAAAMSEDGKKIYTYYGRSDEGNIYLYTFNAEKNKWKKKSFKPVNSKYKETSLILTPKEDTIYFISNNKKTSIGGRDIYMLTKDPKGKWFKPINLGSSINTPYDEEALALHPDGSRLYFSSKGHNTMGGYDIFVSTKDENGAWGKPVNVGYPINTPDDDLFFVMNRSNKYAYYSAAREGSIGEKDIFKIVYLGAEKDPVQAYDNDLIAYFKYDKPLIMRKPIDLLSIDSTIVMIGVVRNAKTQEPVTDQLAKITLIDSDKSELVASAATNADGNYRINVPTKKKYTVEINCQGYLFFLEQIDLSKEVGDEIKKDFAITKIEQGLKVVMKNIFFETGKTTLLPASIEELDKALKLLTENPKLRLEISGHTDNQGSLDLNTKLSEGRAKSVVSWLVEKGIEESRLEYKGYAFTQPIADNKTKDGRAQNRRVEFKVLGNE